MRVYTFELKPLYTAFLQSIKLSEYKVKIILFEKKLLAVNQNDYATKILNA